MEVDVARRTQGLTVADGLVVVPEEGNANKPKQMVISQHHLSLDNGRRAVVSAKRSQEAWQRGEMIGWRQQVVGDQRVEEMLGRQARCPKNVPQGGDDEARREASTEDQASHRDRKQLMGMSAQRLSTRAFGDGRVLLAIGLS